MKVPVPTVAACLVAAVMTTHVPLARAASDFGVVSAAGALGTTTAWSYDSAPVAVGGARYAASSRSDYGLNQASSSTKRGASAYAGSLWWISTPSVAASGPAAPISPRRWRGARPPQVLPVPGWATS